ncbi:MAG: zf-HC2 domain-containing protein [Vicinamibacterales bacterium]
MPSFWSATPRCPDSESLAAYVDGTGNESERARAERHVAMCDECFEILAGVVVFRHQSERRASESLILPPRHRIESRCLGA